MDKEKKRQQFIDKHFNGDPKEFAESMTLTDEEKKQSALGRKNRLRWKDIEAVANCYPEYELKGLMQLEGHLGYLPKPVTYIPHECMIRTLFANYERGAMEEEHFLNEFYFQCKRVRNDDMKKFADITAKKYDERDHRFYETDSPLYKQAARDRLSLFLGEELELEYSLYAEIFLRQLFEMDIFYSGMPFCEIDFRAATIYKYRQTLMLHGEEAADDMDLMPFMVMHERINLP